MSEKNVESTNKPDDAPAYEVPMIEQVVTREGFEREVAYAGVIIISETEGPN